MYFIIQYKLKLKLFMDEKSKRCLMYVKEKNNS